MDPAATALLAAIDANNAANSIRILQSKTDWDIMILRDILNRPTPLDPAIITALMNAGAVRAFVDEINHASEPDLIRYYVRILPTAVNLSYAIKSDILSAALLKRNVDLSFQLLTLGAAVKTIPAGPLPPKLISALLTRGAALTVQTPTCVIPSVQWTDCSKDLHIPGQPPANTPDDREYRKHVLWDTLESLQGPQLKTATDEAKANLRRWATAAVNVTPPYLEVLDGDWGEITQQMTERYGQLYTVLNMAHAEHPGGGYQKGAPAQEETIMYRSSEHFYIDRALEVAADLTNYTPAMTDLLNAKNDRVYLDIVCPRVCIKSKEVSEVDIDPATGRPKIVVRTGKPALKINRTASYQPLGDKKFPFFAMKAAADDLRGPKPFNKASMEKKIEAQFVTAIEKGVKYIVLSAFGCGAFANRPEDVAPLYAAAIKKYHHRFNHIVFAIYSGSNIGGDNVGVFTSSFGSLLRTRPPMPGPSPSVPSIAPPGSTVPGTTIPTNFFIGKPVPTMFDAFTYATTIDVKSTEVPYFAYLCQPVPLKERLSKLPLDQKATAFPPIQMKCETLVDPKALEELAFLEHQCLAFKRGNTYYVSEYAALFYGPNGLFRNPAPRTPGPMKVLAKLFVGYVLPGQFWRRYYALYPLPAKIAAMQKLNTELAEIESEWNSLRQQTI